MKTLDFYEFTGVLCPGVVVLFFTVSIVPEFAPFLWHNSVTIGDLGLFVILSYVAGHLVQAIGNLLEKGFWKVLGGMPTDWVRTRKHEILTKSQIAIIEHCLEQEMGKNLSELTASEWYSVTRSIYATVANAGRSGRVDIFNGNYGLFRGLASAFLFSTFMLIVTLTFKWATASILLSCALLAMTRMQRFGVHYARELFIQFLRLSLADKSGGEA